MHQGIHLEHKSEKRLDAFVPIDEEEATKILRDSEGLRQIFIEFTFLKLP